MSKNKKRPIRTSEQKLRQQMRKNGEEILNTYEVLSLWVLHNKFGYGEKRLLRFLEELTAMAELVIEKRITVKDILTTLKEETGMQIIFDDE